MTGSGLELAQSVRYRHRMGQQCQGDRLITGSSSFPAEPASFLNLLVEKGKATDHGVARVPRAGSTFARHTPAGPL